MDDDFGAAAAAAGAAGDDDAPSTSQHLRDQEAEEGDHAAYAGVAFHDDGLDGAEPASDFQLLKRVRRRDAAQVAARCARLRPVPDP